MSYVCTSYLLSWRMIVVIKSKLWRTRVMYGLGYVSLVCYDTRYAPGTEKGCCVGRTCRHSEAAGGRVELETRSCYSKNVFKDPFGHHHIHYRVVLVYTW